MTLAAVIPARNEARTIGSVVSGARHLVDYLFVVDDGSDDATSEILAGLDVTVIRHKAPRGKAAALASGFEAALATDATGILTLDGDGQHDPAAIPDLVEALEFFPEHLVLGARIVERNSQPGIRRFANRFADFWISWASGQRVPDSQTGFRIYPRRLVEKVRPSTRRRHGFVFESQMLIDGARAGFPCVGVPIRAIYGDVSRPSYFRPGRDVWEIFWMVWWKIWFRGLYLPGLWQVIRHPARMHRPVPDDHRPD